MARKPLITFQGWDGKWWRKIKVGRGIWDAAMFVMPWKLSLGIEAGELIIGEVKRRGYLRKSR